MFDWGMWVRYAPRLMNAILTHFYFVIVSVTIGSVIAVILAIALSRFKKAAKYLMPILGIFQTIPGIVFIGVLFIYIGMRPIESLPSMIRVQVNEILDKIDAGQILVDWLPLD